MNVSYSLLMLVRRFVPIGVVKLGIGSCFFLKVLRQKSFNINYQTSKMKVNKISRNRNLLNAINCLGVASYSIRLFCDLPLA